MTMTSITQKTSIIALSALIVAFAMPSAFAGAGTVEAYYWQNNPRFCNVTGELSTLGTLSQITAELDDSRATYNAEMNGITINAHNGSCSTNVIINGAYDMGWWSTILAQNTATWVHPLPAVNSLDVQFIDFNNAKPFAIESNSCSWTGFDIEWVMNHELGHAVGLKHHDHNPAESIMDPTCDAKWEALQTVDKTAIDIKYP